jgi:hypothetical protein
LFQRSRIEVSDDLWSAVLEIWVKGRFECYRDFEKSLWETLWRRRSTCIFQVIISIINLILQEHHTMHAK